MIVRSTFAGRITPGRDRARHPDRESRSARNLEVAALPDIPYDALAGVRACDVGEFTLEGSGGRPAIGPLDLGGRRGQCRIMRLRRPVDDKARARQRLESGGDRTV